MCPEVLKWVVVMVNVVTVAEVPVVGDYVIMRWLSQTDTRGIDPYRPLTQHRKFSIFFPPNFPFAQFLESQQKSPSFVHALSLFAAMGLAGPKKYASFP